MKFFSSKKPQNPPHREIEKRLFKRHKLEVPVRVRGTGLDGKIVEEETFTLNISLSGADILSNQEYDIKQPIILRVQLSNPIGTEISRGNWVIDARIIKTQNVIQTPEGKFKSQQLLVAFNGILGINKPKVDPWANVTE